MHTRSFFSRAAFSFSTFSAPADRGELPTMNRFRLLAGVLAASGLTGCIMLPPPPMPYRPPPPGLRSEGPLPMRFEDAQRPPPPERSACEVDGASAQERCMRDPSGEHTPRPAGVR